MKLAMIPARGGSKRIPGKNIRSFLGKPIIGYSIQAAIDSGLFDEVMVSTDDDEIKNIALSLGAKVPFLRSNENSDDHATTASVIKEVILQYEVVGRTFDYTCCIYPTAPFVSAEVLVRAYSKLTMEKLQAVFPVMRYSYPIQRALKLSKEGRVDMFYPEFLTSRSQDLEPSYHDAGQFYFFNTEDFLIKGKLFTPDSGGIVISELEGHDIDNEDDWKIAEMKYELLRKR